MSSPTLNKSHVNRPLTNISVAFIQDQSEFIADKVFPIVPVDNKSDDFFVYDKETFARAIANDRSGATESEGSGYDVDTATYNCRQKSFHKDVPADTRANTDAPLDADRDATEFVSTAMLRKRDVDFANAYHKMGIWNNQTSVTGTNRWDDPTSDPYTQIQDAIRVVQKSILVKPNKLIIGPEGFDALKNHPDLKERYKYTTAESLTVEMVSRILGVDILVGECVTATNKEGTTFAGDFVFGKHATLLYAAARPSLYMPSAGYIFAWKAFGNKYGARVDKFPMRHLNNSIRIEGDMAYDTKLVSADAAYFFENVVS